MNQKRCWKSSQNGLEIQTCEKPGEIPTSIKDESNNGKVLISQRCSEQIKNECSDTLQGIKEEKIEAALKQEPTETATESFLNAACDIKVMAEVERISAESESQVNLVGTTHRERPGKNFTTAKSAEEMCSDENIEKYQMEEHFNLKQEPSCDQKLPLPSINEKNDKDKAVWTGTSQKTLIDTGV